MMKLTWGLALLPALRSGGAPQLVRLHVHPSGDDANTGTESSP
eukprot:COSAG01_NODE_52161_length_348_cov_4.132530_1_plen_42_part_01